MGKMEKTIRICAFLLAAVISIIRICIILSIAFVLVIVICSFPFKTPDDLLDIEFLSENVLEYDGKTFYRLDENNSVNNLTNEWDQMDYIGKAKVTREVWDSSIGFAIYQDVRGSYSPDGEINVLFTLLYTWVDTESLDVFDNNFYEIELYYRKNENTVLDSKLPMENIPFDSIVDINQCVPFNSENAKCRSDLTLELYFEDYPLLHERMDVFIVDDIYYVAVSNKHSYSYLIKIDNQTVTDKISAVLNARR